MKDRDAQSPTTEPWEISSAKWLAARILNAAAGTAFLKSADTATVSFIILWLIGFALIDAAK